MTSFTVEAGGAFSMWPARCTKHLQLSIKSPILRRVQTFSKPF